MNNVHDHRPVMIAEVILALAHTTCQQPDPPLFIDLTFGRGGHTQAILHHFPQSRVIAMDRDPEAMAYAKELCSVYGDRLLMVHDSFSNLDRWVQPESAAGILLDLGVSSPQLDQAHRGFSFQHDGPLDMRMSQTGITAEDIVNTWSEKDLANVIYAYGQEHASRRIARAIVYTRQRNRITHTGQLCHIIERCVPRRGKKHPATQTFQALRMLVNNELEEIHNALPKARTCLRPNGVLAALSFHSLEDQMIKQFFKQPSFWAFSTKKPTTPKPEEIIANPRSRSACLRYGVRA